MSFRFLSVLLLATGCSTYLEPPAEREEGLRQAAQCEIDGMLALLNDGTVTESELKDLGVYSRGATNLVATRDGADGIYGTDDDTTFRTLDQVDGVRSVGASSLDALLAWGAMSCTADRFESCRTESILELVNNPVTIDELKALGVHSTGAKNLVEQAPFASLADVDAVSYVGDSSMEALTAWAQGNCSTEVIFSPQPYWESSLARAIELLDAAESTADVAMYSFRDGGVRNALEDAIERGVAVRVLMESAHDDSKDPSGTWSAELEDLGAEVRYVNKIMHHKFAILDGPRHDLSIAGEGTLLSSSGNWSQSAGTRFDENTLVLQDDPRLLLSYQAEFNHLWENGRAVEWNEDIESIDHVTVTPEAIAMADGSYAVFTSENFRTYESSRYGMTFARQGELSTVQDTLVGIIGSATKSVRIATGHLRSRPIAEALMELHEAKPEVEIQVYVDEQEYTSAWYYNEELLEVDDCLAEASTDGQLADCMEKGVHWSHGLFLEGIDLRYKMYSYRWDYPSAPQMHNKYLLVDEAILATGSYNYSPNAEFATMENVAILTSDRYPTILAEYAESFDTIWNTGRDEGIYDELIDDVFYGTGSVKLFWEPVALSWDEVDFLKWGIQEVCPDVDSDDYRENPGRYTTCGRY